MEKPRGETIASLWICLYSMCPKAKPYPKQNGSILHLLNLTSPFIFIIIDYFSVNLLCGNKYLCMQMGASAKQASHRLSYMNLFSNISNKTT